MKRVLANLSDGQAHAITAAGGVLATGVVAAGLALSATIAPTAAAAESFVVCPSGLSAVSTADTSCPFADNVRYAFYHQVGWTVFAHSPVTDKFYTMQCGHAITTQWWPIPKRCFGINDAGAMLVVYIA